MPFLRWSLFHSIVWLLLATAISAVIFSLISNFDYLLPDKVEAFALRGLPVWDVFKNIIIGAAGYFVFGLLAVIFDFGPLTLVVHIGLCAAFYWWRGHLNKWIVIGSALVACLVVSVPAWLHIIEMISDAGKKFDLTVLPLAMFPIIGPLTAFVVWTKRPRQWIGALSQDELESMS